MRVFGAFGLALLMSSTAIADEPAFRQAREHFAAALASDYGLDFDVFPVTPGLPDNPYDSLTTGTFLAFRAEALDSDLVVNGFADALGHVVTLRRSAQFSELVRSLPDDDTATLVSRMMWLFGPMPGARIVDWHPTIPQVGPARKRVSADSALTLEWFVTLPENTGLVVVWKLSVDLPASGKALFHRERILR